MNELTLTHNANALRKNQSLVPQVKAALPAAAGAQQTLTPRHGSMTM